jgi:hypothetical protein
VSPHACGACESKHAVTLLGRSEQVSIFAKTAYLLEFLILYRELRRQVEGIGGRETSSTGFELAKKGVQRIAGVDISSSRSDAQCCHA